MNDLRSDIDLRSDTVTKPTPGMLDAMMRAPVGDDVIDVDPTVVQLQEKTADLLGKEAAIFMPSGTMTNQIALRVHCVPGDEFICETECHIYNYEQGAFAQLSGLVARTVPGVEGVFELDQIREWVRTENDHTVRTRLVCLENTHNRGAGKVFPIDKVRAICAWAQEAGLSTHLDGARLFNAKVATGQSLRELAEPFDSVSVCFSKGLGAPIGSCLAGAKEFVAKARRYRKLFGGGMRQAGIIAAGALYALDHQIERLVEDHQHAKLLAQAVLGSRHFQLLGTDVETNIVIFKVDPSLGTASDIVQRFRSEGILAMAFSKQSIRMVTHLDVDRSKIERVCHTLAKIGG